MLPHLQHGGYAERPANMQQPAYPNSGPQGSAGDYHDQPNRLCNHGRSECAECGYQASQMTYASGMALDPLLLSKNEFPLDSNEHVHEVGPADLRQRILEQMAPPYRAMYAGAPQQGPPQQMLAYPPHTPYQQYHSGPFAGAVGYGHEDVKYPMSPPEQLDLNPVMSNLPYTGNTVVLNHPQTPGQGYHHQPQGRVPSHGSTSGSPVGSMNTKDLICHYWYWGGDCRFSEEQCLYSHKNLEHGKVAGRPIKREPGSMSFSPVAYAIAHTKTGCAGPSVAGKNAAKDSPDYFDWRDVRKVPQPHPNKSIDPHVMNQINDIQAKYGGQYPSKPFSERINKIPSYVTNEGQCPMNTSSEAFNNLHPNIKREAHYPTETSSRGMQQEQDHQQAKQERFQVYANDFLKQASLRTSKQEEGNTVERLLEHQSVENFKARNKRSHSEEPPSLVPEYKNLTTSSSQPGKSIKLESSNSSPTMDPNTLRNNMVVAENNALRAAVQDLSRIASDLMQSNVSLQTQFNQHHDTLFKAISELVPESDQNQVLEYLAACTNNVYEISTATEKKAKLALEDVRQKLLVIGEGGLVAVLDRDFCLSKTASGEH